MLKRRKFITSEGWYCIDEIPKGEFVKRGPKAEKVYIKGNYDRQAKMYEMNHMDDVSLQSLVIGSTKVWAGFTY